MFTGIVEEIGHVTGVTRQETGRRLVLAGDVTEDLPIGASIAVNGVCLTVVESGNSTVAVDVVPETLDKTNLGNLQLGDSVNLERPMAADSRFDGHIVQGHVEGIGVIDSVERAGEAVTMNIEPSYSLMRYIVEKGSITVDGVSLTVAGLGERSFSVALIPHTLEVTTLGLRNPGDLVNLETDVLAKYVERLLGADR